MQRNQKQKTEPYKKLMLTSALVKIGHVNRLKATMAASHLISGDEKKVFTFCWPTALSILGKGINRNIVRIWL